MPSVSIGLCVHAGVPVFRQIKVIRSLSQLLTITPHPRFSSFDSALQLLPLLPPYALEDHDMTALPTICSSLALLTNNDQIYLRGYHQERTKQLPAPSRQASNGQSKINVERLIDYQELISRAYHLPRIGKLSQ